MQGQYKYPQSSVVFLAAFCSVVIVLSPSETPGSQQPFLSNTITIEAASRGYPWINLTDGRALSDGVQADAGGGTRRPLSMAAGDFNKDGVPDLAVGYGTSTGGSIVLYWGNPDSIYPNSPDAQKRKAAGTFTEAPFLPSGLVHEIPVAPDFMEARDLDGDGNCDLLVTAGASDLLYLFHGDGNGNFAKTTQTKLPGRVTTLAVEEYGRGGGYPDISVGIRSPEGPSILIFDWPEEGNLKEFEEIPTSEEVRQLMFARIDGSPGSSLLAAAGHELMIIHGVIHPKLPKKGLLKGITQKEGALDFLPTESQAGGLKEIKAFSPTKSERVVDRYPMPFLIASMALGNFIWDKENLKQIAFISAEGEVHIFNVPNKQVRGAALRSIRSAGSRDARSSDLRLVRTHTSSLATDDLLVFDKSGSQFQILLGDTTALQSEVKHKLPEAFSPISFETRGTPVAVLPMRLNADPLSDLVVLMSGSEEGPTVMQTLAAGTWTVTSDSNDWGCPVIDGVCNSLLGYTSEGTPICGGPCTFWGALVEAMAGAGLQAIQFNIPGAGPHTIPWLGYPDNYFPYPIAVTGTITIDGMTQSGYNGVPLIALDGYGIHVASGSRATVRGLILSGSPTHGIELLSEGNIVEGNYIGTNVKGDAVASHPNPGNGVFIGKTSNNTIGGTTDAARNVISGNSEFQVQLAYATNNTIQGNYIGTNSKGDAALKKDGKDCVKITNVSQDTRIINNVIAGCLSGVSIEDSHENTLGKNKIGTNANGDAVIGNRDAGVVILNGFGNEIGVAEDDSENVISGNSAGVIIEGSGNEITQNKVFLNRIGSDKTGTVSLGNGLGVGISGPEVKYTSVFGNLISGTGHGSFVHPKGPHAIYVQSSSPNLIILNLIGTDITGEKVLGNLHIGYGVKIVDSSDNSVGAEIESKPRANLITGNDVGIALISENAPVKNNTIAFNAIGTDITGKTFLGNKEQGVLVYGVQATSNIIAKNLISGSGQVGGMVFDRDGIYIRYGSNNSVWGNVIGLNVKGDPKLGNKDAGIRIIDGSENKVGVEGTNFISANAFGVVIQSREGMAKKNQIHNNYIGFGKTTDIILGNGKDGIFIEGKDASENQVIKNAVVGSGMFKDPTQANGIHINQGSTNVVKGNVVLFNILGAGIKIWNGSNNIIGGATSAEKNVISQNDIGVAIISENGAAEWNVVAGNQIGDAKDFYTPTPLPNRNQGVLIKGSGATNNTLRGNMIVKGGQAETATPGLGVGIHLLDCNKNNVVGNAIGTNFDDPPNKYVGNKDHGIMIQNSKGNKIGGESSGDPNTIAFNGRDGIFIESGTANAIISNSIFSNEGGGIDLAPGGVNQNDPGDTDSGPNEMQNFPELRSATYLGNTTVISGGLNSKASTKYSLHFYENEECDPSGYGQGKKYLGLIERTTDASGDIGTFAFQVGSLIKEGRFITATATDPVGNTSEFSKCIEVTTSRADADGDGVADQIEDLGPNGGDGNGDGIPDRQQPNVVSFLSVNGKMITLVVTGSCKEAHWTGTSSVSDDPQFDYPFGAMKFRIPCKSARIEIIFHEADDLTGDVFRKYGPVVPGKEGTKKWYTFPAGVSGKRVVFYLGDNRLGDDTGNDGVIVWEGGPARHRRNTKASLDPEH